MNIVQILWTGVGALLFFAVIFFLFTAYDELKKWKNHRPYDKGVWLFLITYLVCFLIVVSFVGIINYKIIKDSHTLPYEWQAKQKAINDIEKYLIRYDNMTTTNLGSIGQGLEANELKKELANKRSELEEVETEMLQWINNPYSAYTDNLIQAMHGAGYYGETTHP